MFADQIGPAQLFADVKGAAKVRVIALASVLGKLVERSVKLDEILIVV